MRKFELIILTLWICVIMGLLQPMTGQPILKRIEGGSGRPGQTVELTLHGKNLLQVIRVEAVRFDEDKINVIDYKVESDEIIRIHIRIPLVAKPGLHKISVLVADTQVSRWIEPDAANNEEVDEKETEPEVEMSYDGDLIEEAESLNIEFMQDSEGVFLSQPFTLKNPGEKAIALSNLNLPQELVLSVQFPDSIAPDQSISFKLRLDSTASNEFSGEMQFSLNQNYEEPFVLRINGNVKRPVESEIAVVDTTPKLTATFDSITVWSQTGKQLLLKNAGSDTLIVSKVQLPKGFIFSDSLPKRIPSGDSAVVQIQLNNSLGKTFEGTLQFQISNIDGQPDYQIKASAVPAPIPGIYISDGVQEITSGQSMPVDFGTTSPGSPLSKKFIIRNTGNTTLLLSDLQLQGGFALNDSFPDSIKAGETANCTIEFKADSAQSLSGQVQFATNIKGHNLINFPVVGTMRVIADTLAAIPQQPSNLLTRILPILALFVGLGGVYFLIKVPIRKYWVKKISSAKPTLEFKPQRDLGSQRIQHSADIKSGFVIRIRPVQDNGSQDVKIEEILLLVDHSQLQSEKQRLDDLARIEGIGPKIASIFQEAGIKTFAQLAKTDVNRLNQILHEAGIIGIADPATWPEQAKLAAVGKWKELDAWQKELKGGRVAID
jgi:hypothetical protein